MYASSKTHDFNTRFNHINTIFYYYVFGYTDTPETLTVQNPDRFVIPAIISAFVIMTTVPIMADCMLKNCTQKIVFVPLSAIGMFFLFVGVYDIDSEESWLHVIKSHSDSLKLFFME